MSFSSDTPDNEGKTAASVMGKRLKLPPVKSRQILPLFPDDASGADQDNLDFTPAKKPLFPSDHDFHWAFLKVSTYLFFMSL